MNNGQVIKEFNGHSGSKVYLMEDNIRLFVRKVGNVDRNFERLHILDYHGFPVPKVYSYEAGQTLDMEYLHGLDMKNYLIHNNAITLYEFIFDTLELFNTHKSVIKDYTQVYHQKLEWLPKDFIFTKEQLIDRLPKLLPQTLYHGDFTLENILFTDPWFHLIDPVTIEYDSFMFDVAKLRQDLVCKWFLRHSDVRLDSKIHIIDEQLKTDYPEACSDEMLILMLLRVLKHCEKDDFNYRFLMKEIERLWK
jgi:hypothetical protein